MDSRTTRILIADMTVSPNWQADPAQRDTYWFSNIPGEDGVDSVSANHLDPKLRPRGGNEGFLDGHVRWVGFKNMLPRTYGTRDDPTFWW